MRVVEHGAEFPATEYEYLCNGCGCRFFAKDAEGWRNRATLHRYCNCPECGHEVVGRYDN
jgi:DNA-directed RNA polymerase subunit RPC12/RpoP